MSFHFVDFSLFLPRVFVKKLWKLKILNLLRKEVIQPQVLLRLPCYDFTPIIDSTFDCCL